MKIVDTSGKELNRDEINFDAGRLLPGDDDGTLIYTTWAEAPDMDAQGEIIDHTPRPSADARMSAIEAAIVDLMLS